MILFYEQGWRSREAIAAKPLTWKHCRECTNLMRQQPTFCEHEILSIFLLFLSRSAAKRHSDEENLRIQPWWCCVVLSKRGDWIWHNITQIDNIECFLEREEMESNQICSPFKGWTVCVGWKRGSRRWKVIWKWAGGGWMISNERIPRYSQPSLDNLTARSVAKNFRFQH